MRAAILAGGRASRFGGRPKGLEQVGGERILDLVVRAVNDALGELPALIANDPAAKQWQPGLEIMPDVVPECGSLGGIYTALTTGEGPVLVVAWDMPFVTPALLEALVAGAAGRDAFLPESTGPRSLEPFCAVYSPACREPIRAQIDDEDYRATAFHEHVEVGHLTLDRVRELGDPATLFFNVNAPADLETAQRMWMEARIRGRD